MVKEKKKELKISKTRKLKYYTKKKELYLLTKKSLIAS